MQKHRNIYIIGRYLHDFNINRVHFKKKPLIYESGQKNENIAPVKIFPS